MISSAEKRLRSPATRAFFFEKIIQISTQFERLIVKVNFAQFLFFQFFLKIMNILRVFFEIFVFH